jgi:hypothetical protein
MKIMVTVENIYGNTLFYPLCEKAKLFAQIAGKKTLTREVLQHIKSLGYVIDLTHREVTV